MEAFNKHEKELKRIFRKSVIYSSKIDNLKEGDINITNVVDLYAIRGSNQRRAAAYRTSLLVNNEYYTATSALPYSYDAFVKALAAKYICGTSDYNTLLTDMRAPIEAIKIHYTVQSRLSDVNVGSEDFIEKVDQYKSQLASPTFATDMTLFLKNSSDLFASASALDPIVFSVVFNVTSKVLHSGSPSSQVLSQC